VWGEGCKLISRSADQPISCYALDLPGFGGSQILKQPMTVGDYANIVAEFIRKLELKNVIIIGHSFGGRVGIKLSSQHPELISKLVLVDSAGFAMNAPKKKLMAMAAKAVRPIFKPQIMQGLRKKIYKNIGAEDYLATPELQKTFVNITSEDLSADLKNIKVPTLIINGENDKDTPVEFGQRMNSLIPNSKLQILNNAGHFSFLDQPEEFVKIVIDFIQS
jgi:pimeloyl-ACP methyl ester carboxylesterase